MWCLEEEEEKEEKNRVRLGSEYNFSVIIRSNEEFVGAKDATLKMFTATAVDVDAVVGLQSHPYLCSQAHKLTVSLFLFHPSQFAHTQNMYI